jgi:hypothetical protein
MFGVCDSGSDSFEGNMEVLGLKIGVDDVVPLRGEVFEFRDGG